MMMVNITTIEKLKQIKSFKFVGKERNQALNKANELMKEYNTKDLRKNF